MAKIKRSPIENQLRAYLRWCESVKQMTPMTMRTKRSVLGRFIIETDIQDMAELTNKRLDRWIEAKACGKFGRQCNATTMRTNIATVTAWITWLRDMGYKLRVRVRLIAKPQAAPGRRKWYSADDIERVLRMCDNLMDEVMIRVLFDTGLRASEFTGLRLRDINGRTIYIVGKGRKQDWVYISEMTRRRLDLWIKTARVVDHLWIKTTRREYYEPLTLDGIRKKIKRAFAAANYEGFQMHELRHSFATDLRKRGADMDVVQKLMRHSSLQVTQRYLHNLDGDMCDIWDSIKNYELAPVGQGSVVCLRGELVNVS